MPKIIFLIYLDKVLARSPDPGGISWAVKATDIYIHGCTSHIFGFYHIFHLQSAESEDMEG